MAEITGGYIQRCDSAGNQAETTSTTYVNIAELSSGDLLKIPSSSLVADNEYLVIVQLHYSNGSSSISGWVRCVSGSGSSTGSFPDSESGHEPNGNKLFPYFWFTRWTPASGEELIMQMRTSSAAAEAQVYFASILFMQTGDIPAGALYYDINTVSNTVGTSWSSTFNASASFTPGTADNRWLLAGFTRWDVSSVTAIPWSRLVVSGSTIDSSSQWGWEHEDVLDEVLHGNTRWWSLPASAHTIEMEASMEAGSQTRLANAILALDLDATFKNVATQYSASAFNFTANSTYADNFMTHSIDPDQAGNIIYLSGGRIQPGSTSAEIILRQQVDSVDSPGNMTAANRGYRAMDGDDIMPITIMSRENEDDAVHTIAFDGGNESAAAGFIDQRWAIVFTLELGAAPVSVNILTLNGALFEQTDPANWVTIENGAIAESSDSAQGLALEDGIRPMKTAPS